MVMSACRITNLPHLPYFLWGTNSQMSFFTRYKLFPIDPEEKNCKFPFQSKFYGQVSLSNNEFTSPPLFSLRYKFPNVVFHEVQIIFHRSRKIYKFPFQSKFHGQVRMRNNEFPSHPRHPPTQIRTDGRTYRAL